MIFDLTINLGNILTIVSFFGGGIAFVVSMRSRVDALAQRTLKMEDKLDKLAELSVINARHDERITAMHQQMINQGRRLDDTIFRLNAALDQKIVGAVDKS